MLPGFFGQRVGPLEVTRGIEEGATLQQVSQPGQRRRPIERRLHLVEQGMIVVEPSLESPCPGDLGLQLEASLTGRAEIDRLPEPAPGPGGSWKSHTSRMECTSDR